MKKPLSPEVLAASLKRSRTIILDLEDLRSRTGVPQMDSLDMQLFAEALSPLQTPEQVFAVRAEIRRSCEFCPTAKRVTEIVEAVIGKNTETIPAHYADTRQIIDRCRTDQEGRQKQIEGIAPEKREENRDRAREIVASLSARSGMDSAKPSRKFGEAPDFLKGELEQLAEKRARIEESQASRVVPVVRTRRRVAR